MKKTIVKNLAYKKERWQIAARGKKYSTAWETIVASEVKKLS